MSRPTHTLKHEHRIIEQALRALVGLCVRLELDEPIPVEPLVHLLDFVQIYADRFHHEKEEMVLFPALAQSGMQVEGGPLGFLQHEHQVERQLLIELGAAVTDYRHGDEAAKHRIVAIARSYSRHQPHAPRRCDFISAGGGDFGRVGQNGAHASLGASRPRSGRKVHRIS